MIEPRFHGKTCRSDLAILTRSTLAFADGEKKGIRRIYEADFLLENKGYDVDEQVIQRLSKGGKIAVVLPRRNRKETRDYNQSLIQARHHI